jgi:predicted RNA-binding protein with TRAM domain
MVGAVHRWRRRAGAALAAGALFGATTACAEPVLDDEEPAEAAPADPIPDPTHAAVLEEVTRLGDSVAAARTALAEAAGADDVASARRAGQAAVGRLLADGTTTSEVPPLLPAETTDRETRPTEPDALTATLTAAREAGGELGERVTGIDGFTHGGEGVARVEGKAVFVAGRPAGRARSCSASSTTASGGRGPSCSRS